MRPYSTDLRERILAAVARGEHSLRQLAHLFAVSLSFVVRLLQRHRRAGSLQPAPPAGGPTPTFDAPTVARLLQLVADQPDATLAELRTRLGVCCHLSTLARILQKHRLTRKKKSHPAQERGLSQAAIADADSLLRNSSGGSLSRRHQSRSGKVTPNSS
jgi:transposase